MSRRYATNQRPRVILQSVADNPYQTTTLPIAHHQYINEKRKLPNANLCTKNCSRCTILSDESLTDTNTYYDYFADAVPRNEKNKNASDFLSDDSGSHLPHYEEVSLKRHSRNAFCDRSIRKSLRPNQNQTFVHKDVRRVYPNQNGEIDRLYQEVAEVRCSSDSASNVPNRSRLSDRPQSSLSSGVGSVVHGCGGRCPTFENVCYYFLQVAFTMGILIGSSLCIAGAVLRKSAARNLQVLVYIGAMVSLVSALLLGVQCNARKTARKRQKALRNAKMRAPIPMETLHGRGGFPVQQQPLVVPLEHPQRVYPQNLPVPFQQGQVQRPILINGNPAEQDGVPWWRRKDLNK